MTEPVTRPSTISKREQYIISLAQKRTELALLRLIIYNVQYGACVRIVPLQLWFAFSFVISVMMTSIL